MQITNSVFNNFSVFSKIVKFLAKISTELYLEFEDNGLHLKSINNSKTAFADVTFPKAFFSMYRISVTNNLNDFDKNNCRLSVRPLLNIFKGLKSISSCKIEINAPNSMLLVEFTNKKLTKKTHYVAILEHENLENFDGLDSYPNT